ncbi:Arabinose operon regulatory protein [compost metagenome]
MQHHPLFIERFWLDIVNLVIPANLSAIQKAMEERKISYPIEMSVLPILIHVQRWHKSLTLRDEKILEYGLKQAAAETLQNLQLDVQMLSLDRNELLAVLMIPNDYSLNINEIKNNLRTYVSSCYPYFYCDLACYVGDRVLMERLPEMVRQLLTMQKNNVAYYNEVFLRGEQPRISTPAAMPDMKLWLVMLVKGAYEQVILEVQQFMNKTVQHSEIDVSFMHQFHHDFMQIVYFVLREKGIQAHKLFQDSRSIELSAGAGRSVVDMLNWIHHIVMKTMDYIQDVEQSHSVADKVRTFITKHFDQDLSREQIANQFYLHPDYLDRLLKKEIGVSMKEYMLQERLRISQELLSKTDMPVTEVATYVGMNNLSYFTKVFRKYIGLNPSDFRKRG